MAVKEFNLSWEELVKLSRNSLYYSFAPEDVKAKLLQSFDRRIDEFENKILNNSSNLLSQEAETYGFMCRHYKLCAL